MRKREFTVPKKHQPFFNFVKRILRLFIKKRRIVNLAGELPSKCIFTANHVSKGGPLVYELYFPCIHAPWGAGEMLGNYSSRKAYLRDVYYIRKKKCGKFRANLKAGFEALFSIYFYRGMRVIGTHTDTRLVSTIANTIEVLDADIPVMIFPEDSNDGYFDVLTEFFPGFVMLAQQYYRRRGIDLPIYPVYYHEKKRLIVIEKPLYIQHYTEQGMDRKEIAEIVRTQVNDLYYRCERGEFDAR